MRHYLIACILPFLLPYSVLGDKGLEQLLSEGNRYLTTGQFNNALTSFDAALSQDPENYLTYFKRATTYLSLGRHHAAIDDFTTILTLKPDFEKALLERARIYAKEGHFDLAIHDLAKYMNNKPNDNKAKKLLETVKKSKQHLEQAKSEKKKGRLDTCISLTTSVIRASPLSVPARLLRAQCYVANSNIDEAMADYARVAQLRPDDADILVLLSNMNFYSLYEPQTALTHVKQCLHYDPEQKQCKALFKKIKRLDKEIKTVQKDIELLKFATASNRLIGTANREGLLKEIDQDMVLLEQHYNLTQLPRRLHSECYRLACNLFGQQKSDEDKIELWCSKALAIEPNSVDALVYRSKVLLRRKDFESAVRDLERANQITEGQNRRVRQLLQQAQQRLKMSKKRDYYKLLEVSPDADSREIKKAYRKKAHTWHPDKYSGDLDKEAVEQKMAEINQAYEVLSDPDKRQQYDNGFDPYDSEQEHASGFHGNPFGSQAGGFSFNQGGFPFQFNGGEFKMHFQ